MNIQTDANGYPMLDQFSADGFVDLTFRIFNFSEDHQRYHFHLAALHRNIEVGMNVTFEKEIQSGFDSEMHLIKDHVYYRGVQFLRSGDDSDRLVSAIGELYGLPVLGTKMIPEETFTAIALHQGNLDFGNQPVKLKLFGRDGEQFDEDAYYESFFNVDLRRGYVFWNEKDQDFRKPLLRALAAE